MATATQAYRKIAIDTELGKDKLLLLSATFHEQLGRNFQIEATMAAEDATVNFNKVVGTDATIRLEMKGGKTRYWNGIVSQFTQVGVAGHMPVYKATLVPWLWLLGRTADFRVFQNQTVPDIIKKIFSDKGFSDFRESYHGTYAPWEYCVQYRESSLNFISRLMEQEGIYYFFEHENGKHTLVLADSASAHKDAPGYGTIKYAKDTDEDPESERIDRWELDQRIQPGSYEVADYDFKKPPVQVKGSHSVSHSHNASDFDVFEYPAECETADEANHYAQIRLEELQAQFQTAKAGASAKGITCGCTFTLAEYPRADQNIKYLVTGTSLSITTSDFRSGAGGGQGGGFSCRFTAVDARTPFRPPRVTPKPIIQGPQTGVVVGPAGEEIYTDQYGRIKVQFHWDRYGQKNEKSSMFIRPTQTWAGKRWGMMFLPRIGMEVLIEFIDGDPDQPVVVGCLYNGSNMPPYPLPDHKTCSTIKTSSSKGGSGNNEIRFEDNAGEEQLFIQAQKNYDTHVKNDSFENVDNDRHLVVGKDKFEHIKNDRSETVDRDHKEYVKRDVNLTVDGKQAILIQETRTLHVLKDVAEKYDANHSQVVTQDSYVKATNVCIEALNNITLMVGNSYIAIQNDGIHISTQGQIKIDSIGPMDVQSQAKISAQGQMQVEVKGMMISIEADVQAQLKGTMVQVQGSAMTQIQGGITMIG